MKDFARSFYISDKWRKVSSTYMKSKSYLCERCGAPAKICHHKIYLTPMNITDPTISLSMDNLECLCQDCHQKEHTLKRSIAMFDDEGKITEVRKSKEEKQFDSARDIIDDILNKMTP